ncbi:hypothetical protein [uncultured Dysgonomonas sp.]|uniref:Uncharacterized protein n=1 Tax=uncultured Dysgonomonas sp. TaxID=206096 RepID=A0A212J7S1_9BACT|nr:hypothetical protein [uncultured Dysgonomonas sp.]SBV95468.1 hypothetical protein KL86DYS1_11399 [uncultured Dysgonomonas sp.]
MKKKVNIQRDLISRNAIENKAIPEIKAVAVVEIDKLTEEVIQDDKGENDKEQKADQEPESKEQKKGNGKAKRNA